MKLCWLAHNLLLLPLAGKHWIPFHSGWDWVIFVFLTLLADKKPSNMIAGCTLAGIFIFWKSCWLAVKSGYFFPGKLNVNIGWRKSTLLAFTTSYNQFCEKCSLGTPDSFASSSKIFFHFWNVLSPSGCHHISLSLGRCLAWPTSAF